MAQFGLVQNLVNRWHHLHCLQSWPPGYVTWIATFPWIAILALSVSVELVSLSARVTSDKFQYVAEWCGVEWCGVVWSGVSFHFSLLI